VDGEGVGIRVRFCAYSPAVRSTGAPLIPEPPMSMPNARSVMSGSSHEHRDGVLVQHRVRPGRGREALVVDQPPGTVRHSRRGGAGADEREVADRVLGPGGRELAQQVTVSDTQV